MARPKANVATNAGTRRSERKAPVRFPHPYDGIQDIQKFTEETDPQRFPGMHLVLVDKANPEGGKFASDIGYYKGEGYKEVSSDPEITGHADKVLMGIPVDKWINKEDNRVADDNSALTELIEGQAAPFENMNATGMRFVKNESGVSFKEPIAVSGEAENGD